MTSGGPPLRAAYLRIRESGGLTRRAEAALNCLSCCRLCGNSCACDRAADSRAGVCGTGRLAAVASCGPHHGEEAPLRGRRGSGTIFFSRCNLRCVFCQNWEISQEGRGREVDRRELAALMCRLQDQGCHNINLVSPSHVVAQILEALPPAVEAGLHLPLVYNSGGYDSPEVLELLDGVVDVYMPDLKYADGEIGSRYSGISDYGAVSRAALREMHRQVGDLILDKHGLARRGLLVRHLVLPGLLDQTDKVLEFIAGLSIRTYLNLMDQYRPCHMARVHPPLDRPLGDGEYGEALRLARKHGLERLDPG